jgi:hypothetical protein
MLARKDPAVIKFILRNNLYLIAALGLAVAAFVCNA